MTGIIDTALLRPAWAEVDLDVITANYTATRRQLSPGTKFMAVVKGNAYGCGAVVVAGHLLALGADYLAVAILDEALELRQAGIGAPILVLGFTPPEQAEIVVRNEITQTVFQPEMAAALSREAVRLGKAAKVHVKVDTGMGRIGLAGAEAVSFVHFLRTLPGLDLEGIFTHYAVAEIEAAGDLEYCEQQYRAFRQVVDELSDAGIRFPLQHVANSAGIVNFPQAHGDMVRAGSSVLGILISPAVNERLGLRPTLSLKARIGHINTLPAGSSVSYGRTYVTGGPTRVATLPIGYADGFSRMLSNRGEVLIGGQRVPIIGRVCMDQCMVDITQVTSPVRVGDEAVLIGRQGSESITAVAMAETIGGDLNDLEILSLLSRRLPRVYLREGSPVAWTDLSGRREDTRGPSR